MVTVKTLQQHRANKDLSLGECARKAGLTPRQLSAFEHGQEKPTTEQISRIATVLGIEPHHVSAALASDEEIADSKKKMGAFMSAFGAVATDAKEHGLRRGNGGRGEIECPACGDRLRYSVASVNGHIWGACVTPGCVRWMQ